MNVKELEEILSYATKDAGRKAILLAGRYDNMISIAEADESELVEVMQGDKSAALYLKLASALTARRVCDGFKMPKKHTDEEIREFLVATFYGRSIETVYAISIDEKGRCVSIDMVGSGTINYSNIIPRRIIEVAKANKAVGVIVTHNHPGGIATPSSEDIAAQRLLANMLLNSGITLEAGFVIAGTECNKITT